jgi:ribosome-binding protein aMBF1 (putative translation factor)
MKRLKSEREARGWSRAELARRARVNPSTVGLIEAGRFVPYRGQVAKLARALGLSERDLVNADDAECAAAERAAQRRGADASRNGAT